MTYQEGAAAPPPPLLRPSVQDQKYAKLYKDYVKKMKSDDWCSRLSDYKTTIKDTMDIIDSILKNKAWVFISYSYPTRGVGGGEMKISRR